MNFQPIVPETETGFSASDERPVDALNAHELTSHLRTRTAEVGYAEALREPTGDWWRTSEAKAGEVVS